MLLVPALVPLADTLRTGRPLTQSVAELAGTLGLTRHPDTGIAGQTLMLLILVQVVAGRVCAKVGGRKPISALRETDAFSDESSARGAFRERGGSNGPQQARPDPNRRQTPHEQMEGEPMRVQPSRASM